MVNGIINVYKEKGYTSFDVVAKMRGIFHQKKIGHTGTLDPDAEGVLPVCLGKATKVCDLLTDKDKVYRTVLLLGQETDTQDISGQVLKKCDVNVTEEQVRDVIGQFKGPQKQIPPMYSALKVNGKKLYELAREGKTIERKARDIEVFDIKIERIELPEVEMTVHCSKGTYIRTICNDIGEKLGCFGCMKSLLRTRVAGFDIKDAMKLSKIQEKADAGDHSMVISVDSVFDDLVRVNAAKEADKLVRNGNKLPVSFTDMRNEKPNHDVRYRLYTHDGIFIGVYSYIEDTSEFKPIKIFME
ncbi:tRNA pseudouridine(55) synthase TruB [Agathobacter sp.]